MKRNVVSMWLGCTVVIVTMYLAALKNPGLTSKRVRAERSRG